MKIRNGFVSNSSSSSFIYIVEKEFESSFEKAWFKHYCSDDWKEWIIENLEDDISWFEEKGETDKDKYVKLKKDLEFFKANMNKIVSISIDYSDEYTSDFLSKLVKMGIIKKVKGYGD